MNSIDIAYYAAAYGGAICIGILSRSTWIALIGSVAWGSIVFLIASSAA